MQSTEAAMLQTTMDIVAEKGLDGFSMKQVTTRMGVAESLLYKYFGTKENLLYQCFLVVNRQIGALFENVTLPPACDEAAIAAFVQQQWERYFLFMVGNGSRSLFYYSYRDSRYLSGALMGNNPEMAQAMAGSVRMMQGIVAGAGVSLKVPADYAWLYLLESTGSFVRYIIRNGLDLKEVDLNSVWRLVSGGLLGAVR